MEVFYASGYLFLKTSMNTEVDLILSIFTFQKTAFTSLSINTVTRAAKDGKVMTRGGVIEGLMY